MEKLEQVSQVVGVGNRGIRTAARLNQKVQESTRNIDWCSVTIYEKDGTNDTVGTVLQNPHSFTSPSWSDMRPGRASI